MMYNAFGCFLYGVDMRYNKLGGTDVEVSAVCLGTMTWGSRNTEEQAHKQLDFAVDKGINIIDTAELYPVPVDKEWHGRTEEYIGTWLKNRNDRDKLIIATKVVGKGKTLDFRYLRDVDVRNTMLDRQNIESAVEGSLRRLQTDYIDLYQMHWPDRKTSNFGKLNYQHDEGDVDHTPILETLRALDDLVKAGKIRYIGISNETPWGVMQYLYLAGKYNLPRIVTIQNPYNLLNRSFEVGLSEIAIREKCGLLAYSPLADGVLTAKYLTNNPSSDSRLIKNPGNFRRYSSELATKAVGRYKEIAGEYGVSPAQMALSFACSRKFVTAVIVGATKLEQLEENINAIDIVLPDDVLQKIEEVYAQFQNTSP